VSFTFFRNPGFVAAYALERMEGAAVLRIEDAIGKARLLAHIDCKAGMSASFPSSHDVDRFAVPAMRLSGRRKQFALFWNTELFRGQPGNLTGIASTGCVDLDHGVVAIDQVQRAQGEREGAVESFDVLRLDFAVPE
jgi:hypothetical protein